MAYKIVLLPRSEADIAEAFRYLAEVDRDVAARWYRHIRADIESLNESPSRCPVIPEASKLNFELRHLIYGKRPGVYRIVFRLIEATQEVHIVTVRHGARKPLTPDDMEPFVDIA